jgi:hypothetical protein
MTKLVLLRLYTYLYVCFYNYFTEHAKTPTRTSVLKWHCTRAGRKVLNVRNIFTTHEYNKLNLLKLVAQDL